MTIIQETAPIVTTQCPPWCSGNAETHPDSEGETMHSCPVGALGVCVEQWGDLPVRVYVPALDVDALTASAAFARQLGSDLIAAADRLEQTAPETTSVLYRGRRPSWARTSSEMYAHEFDSELEIVVGGAAGEAVSTDTFSMNLEAGEWTVTREVTITVWDIDADISRGEIESFGPFTLEQARGLSDADLPGSRPGFAAQALEAVSQLMDAIDGRRESVTA